MGTSGSSQPAPRRRPLLGVRRRPGRLALGIFRLPVRLYRAGWGWLLGRTFLLLVHTGRRTGQPHATTVMVLGYDPENREAVVCSAWGASTDWIRNIQAHPALRVQIGRDSFAPRQRFLSTDESFAAAVDFRRRHPWRLRLLARVLGWPDLRSDDALRDFVRTKPFVAFRPIAAGQVGLEATTGGS